MPNRDSGVDAYIEKAAPFAHPILRRLREIVHAAEPDVVETIKWGMPFFERDGVVAHMAAFKAHCAFGIWRGGTIVASGKDDDAMGQLGRIESLADLPPEREIAGWVKEKVRRNRSGEKPAPVARAPKAEIPVPPAFARALAKSAEAKRRFAAFSPSHRREYLEWITEAKTDATRDRRIATAIEWIGDGRSLRWKYERPKPAAVMASAKKAPVKKAAAKVGRKVARKAVGKKAAAKASPRRKR